MAGNHAPPSITVNLIETEWSPTDNLLLTNWGRANQWNHVVPWLCAGAPWHIHPCLRGCCKWFHWNKSGTTKHLFLKGVLSDNPEESFHKYFLCLLDSRDLAGSAFTQRWGFKGLMVCRHYTALLRIPFDDLSLTRFTQWGEKRK